MSELTPDAIRAVCVVVPAHDEEELLERCLSSVRASAAALSAARPPVPTCVVVVLDSCTDGSAAIAARCADHVVTTDARSVGVARALGVRRATALSPGVPLARVWVASTDADTVVPPDWLTCQVAAADAGADLVLGPVRPDPGDTPPDALAAWRREGPDAVSADGSVHGANLGVRLDAYLRAGGFLAYAEHEDVALVRALDAAGARRAVGVAAVTSGRTNGRSPGGFAGYLRLLADACAEAPPLVSEA